jgi:hypothetical protein
LEPLSGVVDIDGETALKFPGESLESTQLGVRGHRQWLRAQSQSGGSVRDAEGSHPGVVINLDQNVPVLKLPRSTVLQTSRQGLSALNQQRAPAIWRHVLEDAGKHIGWLIALKQEEFRVDLKRTP